MASQDEQKYDEKLLTRYLLGSLSREETERLDELSVVDDDFAALLNAAENDLVDAYVTKELSPRDSEKFAAAYLSSPRRREKVEFAQTLVDFKPLGKTSSEAEPALAEKSSGAPADAPPRKRSGWGWMPRLAFAGMSFALLLIAGYLFRENLNLRTMISSGAARQDSILQDQRQLEQKLAEQRSANADLQRQLDQAQSQPNLDQLKTVTLLLLPPTRGVARVPVLTVHPGTNVAVMLLTLEADDFATYQAALKDPASGSMLWRSADLQSEAQGERKAVSLAFPTALLKQQNYTVELTGASTRGRLERIGSYPFRVVIK